jgi:hypothetical protein
MPARSVPTLGGLGEVTVITGNKKPRLSLMPDRGFIFFPEGIGSNETFRNMSGRFIESLYGPYTVNS